MRQIIGSRQRIVSALLGVVLLAGVTVALSGCDAVAGAGQDISAGGHAITRSAEQTKANNSP